MNHDSLIDDEAMVLVMPFDPVKRKPWVSDGRKSVELNVDEAVENRPFWNPMVVLVALYDVKAVKGKVLPPRDDRVRHVPEIEKQPVVMFSPTLDVEVA